jgi:hypothetical protein
VTDDADDCILTTTTKTPEVGCCAGDSEKTTAKTTERCNEAAQADECERKQSCNWRSGEDADCSWTETSPPEEPGYCYVNVRRDGSVGCDVRRVRDGERVFGHCQRRRRESVYVEGHGGDCEALWPTTTSEAPGCCAGRARCAMSEKETNDVRAQ